VIRTLNSRVKCDLKSVAYIPALGLDCLTPFFDSLMKWAARETAFKQKLIEQSEIRKGFRILDLGCGTATLTILLKKRHPEAEVTGIDIDPRVLSIAREKAAAAGVEVKFDLGTAFELPYTNNHFDIVVSSLVFHHLTRQNKVRTLKEVLRVLKPNGELLVADLGKPQNAIMRLPASVIRHLEETEDNVKGLIPAMFRMAGFEQVEETSKTMTMFGTVALYKGRKPLEMPVKSGIEATIELPALVGTRG
jgi:ubiquinone/menaquinone biosynthesis C-methylase UbiE